MAQTAVQSPLRRVDAATLGLYIVLVLVGLVAVFSVEYSSQNPGIFVASKSHARQAVWLGISLVVGLFILLTDSKAFSSVAFLSYLVGVALLLLTLAVGAEKKGSHSWLGVGSFAFQPGEVCKIFTSLALARFLSLTEVDFRTFKHRAVAVAIALVPCAIIILQNETGLALVYFSFLFVLYREGLPNAILITGVGLIILTLSTLLIERQTLFIILTALAVLIGLTMRRTLARSHTAKLVLVGAYAVCIAFSQFAVPYAFKNVLKSYQIERVYSTLGQDVPDEYIQLDESGEKLVKKDPDYNVRQSKIAIGSGGLLGEGLGNGTSTKNNFVPEQNTDFIFSSIGEQFGFLGSAVLVLLYLALMLRIVHLAERQRSAFSRVYAYCVASILFFHFAINVSMTIGLAPVIGITLPFLSYGGSSLLSFSVLVFILLRLDADRGMKIR